MITSLRSSPPSLDLAIGLTEGWIAGLLAPNPPPSSQENDYRLVGQWVSSPLRWAIVTGRNRHDVKDMSSLTHRRPIRVGVSRMGSGSHIMASVLAQQQGWRVRGEESPLEFIPLGPFAELRRGVSDEEPQADFFMWEHFTTKPYFDGDRASLKKIGEIKTPWPAWMITANTHAILKTDSDDILRKVLMALCEGVQKFEEGPEKVVEMLGTGELGCRYGEEDARMWLQEVEFVKDIPGIERRVLLDVAKALEGAGVVQRSVIERLTGPNVGEYEQRIGMLK
ncbi:MAG: hypothetical protein Q9227_001396 [Pyrenula ochraceoflavens]